ncbi:MAG: flagellar motor protein MotA [Oleispira sp.]|jgi:biopolymer transport protein ExbB|nr:flagellar motor protein MotA [Oleispira sp.]|tara:strand:- start:5136 stop:5795 length:660 start_codon:yes stop_codon:yes gene_type:complete
MYAFIDSIGGPVVAILLGFSLVATAMILLKFIQIILQLPAKNGSPAQLIKCLQRNEPKQLILLAQGQRSSYSQLLGRSVDLLQQNTLSIQDAHSEIARQARSLTQSFYFYLRPLEVIATLAPLLGLFGTVLGMIEAFKAMEAAGSQVDPAVLSGGIWQALLTTAVGLGVAIPVSLIHSVFERRAEQKTHQLQNDLGQVFTYFASPTNSKLPSVEQLSAS